MISREELSIASRVANTIREMGYVSKERFYAVAKARYNVGNPEQCEYLYGLLSAGIRNLWMLEAREGKYKEKFAEDIALALSIGEEAYNIYVKRDGALIHFNKHEANHYDEDKRRYFYATKDKIAKTEDGYSIRSKTDMESVDIDLKDAADLILLGEMMKREDIEIFSVVPQLGTLVDNGKSTQKKEVRIPYFDGDIIFVYSNPADEFHYSYYDSKKNSGVYLATKEGFLKLLYTPGRGYVDGDGDIQYEDDEHHYSEYKIQGFCDAQRWRVVGNIHNDDSILYDTRKKQKKSEN